MTTEKTDLPAQELIDACFQRDELLAEVARLEGVVERIGADNAELEQEMADLRRELHMTKAHLQEMKDDRAGVPPILRRSPILPPVLRESWFTRLLNRFL